MDLIVDLTCLPKTDPTFVLGLGGLAKAGGSGNERQPATHGQALVQPLDQARAENNFRPGRRDIKFTG
jgi:hypothetical protein